jgi:hypothetical protein
MQRMLKKKKDLRIARRRDTQLFAPRVCVVNELLHDRKKITLKKKSTLYKAV